MTCRAPGVPVDHCFGKSDCGRKMSVAISLKLGTDIHGRRYVVDCGITCEKTSQSSSSATFGMSLKKGI